MQNDASPYFTPLFGLSAAERENIFLKRKIILHSDDIICSHYRCRTIISEGGYMTKLKRAFAAVLCIIVMLSAFSVGAYAADDSRWVGAWSTTPVEAVVESNGVKLSDFLMNSTVRIILKPTLSGTRVRFKISNRFGNTAIKINGINVARAVGDDSNEILTETIIPLKVRGAESFSVAAGEYAYTDPVDMKVDALETIAVTYYVSAYQQMRTEGFIGAKAYITTGNKITEKTLSNSVLAKNEISGLAYNTIPYLINMDVWASGAESIVFIGDSTLANDIPALVAQKLVGSGVKNIGVLQQAVAGNRLLYDGVGLIGNIYGPATVDRFADDAIKQKGVSKIFVKVGVNDILHPRTKSMKGKAPEASVEDIINGYKKLVHDAHKNGIQIYFFEITPWKGYTRELLTSGVDLAWDEETQSVCDEVNEWIKSNKEADGYIDLSVLRDESDIFKLKDAFTIDGAHFATEGQIEAVDAIPEKFLGDFKEALTPLKTLIYGNNIPSWGEKNDKPENPANSVTPAVKDETKPSEKPSQNTEETSEADTTQSAGEVVNINHNPGVADGISNMQVGTAVKGNSNSSLKTLLFVISGILLLLALTAGVIAAVFIASKKRGKKTAK